MRRAATNNVAVPVVVLLLSMAACTTMPPAGAPLPRNGACNVDAASWAIGRAVTPGVVERARVATRSGEVRVIEPGQPDRVRWQRRRVTRP